MIPLAVKTQWLNLLMIMQLDKSTNPLNWVSTGQPSSHSAALMVYWEFFKHFKIKISKFLILNLICIYHHCDDLPLDQPTQLAGQPSSSHNDTDIECHRGYQIYRWPLWHFYTILELIRRPSRTIALFVYSYKILFFFIIIAFSSRCNKYRLAPHFAQSKNNIINITNTHT